MIKGKGIKLFKVETILLARFHYRLVMHSIHISSQVYQKLGSSMYITEAASASMSLLLHDLHYTLAYTRDHNTNHWDQVATLPAHGGCNSDLVGMWVKVVHVGRLSVLGSERLSLCLKWY